MEKLFSCCLVLEDLSINATIAVDTVPNFEVSSPELKTLRVSFLNVFVVEKDIKYGISKMPQSLTALALSRNICRIIHSRM